MGRVLPFPMAGESKEWLGNFMF